MIDAAVHTLIGRKTAGPSFDESPVGLRRRRSMVEGLKRIDSGTREPAKDAPGLATITAIVALDYVRFRFPGAGWMPRLERLDHLRERMRGRPSIERTMPHD